MRKLKLFIGLAALLALPALGSATAFAADSCPPGATTPAYCPYTQAPTVTTGPATAIQSTSATVTGTINPRGASVRYRFEYGTTIAYGSFTPTTLLPATTSTVPVAATITGLAPNTTYHYRLVAVNNAGASGVGQDMTFTTLAAAPGGKLKTKLTLKAKPKRDKHPPFSYRFSGRVKIPGGVSKAAVCGGKVKLRLFRGHTLVAKGTANVSTHCTYAKRITIGHLKRPRHHKKGTLKVVGRYGGNAFLKPSTKSTKVFYF